MYWNGDDVGENESEERERKWRDKNYVHVPIPSDMYTHCAQVWYSWLRLGAISIAWLPAPSCAIAIYLSVN